MSMGSFEVSLRNTCFEVEVGVVPEKMRQSCEQGEVKSVFIRVALAVLIFSSIF